jgi:UDP-2,3-diacylglucosamine pyrophosphatase LpxH
MLVVISDLHLSDGARGPTLSEGAFQLFADRLTELAAGASSRAGGSYQPIERIDLVLLGDVLDVVSSRRWLDGSVRPWDGPQSRSLSETAAAITADIVRRNDGALGVLRSLAQGCVRLTPANRLGRRAATSETVSVPVKIHYMVGNRDWLFHLPGQAYDRLRRQLVVHLGLANEPDAPFPHEPWENGELLQALRRHRVLARHGDVFDPLCCDGRRNASSLDDLLAIELFARFAADVDRELAHELPPGALNALGGVECIRPLVLAPAWINGLLLRTSASAAARQQLKRIWDALAEALLDHPFAHGHGVGRPASLRDGLARALLFGRAPATDWVRATTAWLHSLRGTDSASYCAHALAEEDFRNRRARHIVYGHTHQAEETPLEISSADGYVLQQTYFNSGTWRPVLRPAALASRAAEFAGAHALTFHVFYQGDERCGRLYESWSGSLGINPNAALTGHRVDAGEAAQDGASTRQNTPFAPPVRAPHFQALPSTARS